MHVRACGPRCSALAYTQRLKMQDRVQMCSGFFIECMRRYAAKRLQEPPSLGLLAPHVQLSVIPIATTCHQAPLKRGHRKRTSTSGPLSCSRRDAEASRRPRLHTPRSCNVRWRRLGKHGIGLDNGRGRSQRAGLALRHTSFGIEQLLGG